jgi:predicted permease
MLEILTIIAPLFLIILGGAVFQYKTKADESWSTVLNSYALKIGFPALIFAALAKTNFNLTEEADLILANSALLLGSFALVLLASKIFKLKEKLTRTLFICLGFGNVAYLGIPTLTQISGNEILPTASLIVAVHLFWVFTIGIGYLECSRIKCKKDLTKEIFLKLIKNPLLIAVVAGILFGKLQIPIPEVIGQSIDMIAASVTPVVLLVIGLFIGKSKLDQIKKWLPALAFSATTLLALPALMFLGILAMGQPRKPLSLNN